MIKNKLKLIGFIGVLITVICSTKTSASAYSIYDYIQDADTTQVRDNGDDNTYMYSTIYYYVDSTEFYVYFEEWSGAYMIDRVCKWVES